jgi:hypothetical protein
MFFGILDFTPGAAADVPIHIEDKYIVAHIDLPLVEFIEAVLLFQGQAQFIVAVLAATDGQDDFTSQG